jgi:hypothetical protein
MGKCNIPHASSTGLSGTGLSTLIHAVINNTERPVKYDNIAWSTGQLFTFAIHNMAADVAAKLKHTSKFDAQILILTFAWKGT